MPQASPKPQHRHPPEGDTELSTDACSSVGRAEVSTWGSRHAQTADQRLVMWGTVNPRFLHKVKQQQRWTEVCSISFVPCCPGSTSCRACLCLLLRERYKQTHLVGLCRVGHKHIILQAALAVGWQVVLRCQHLCRQTDAQTTSEACRLALRLPAKHRQHTHCPHTYASLSVTCKACWCVC